MKRANFDKFHQETWQNKL